MRALIEESFLEAVTLPKACIGIIYYSVVSPDRKIPAALKILRRFRCGMKQDVFRNMYKSFCSGKTRFIAILQIDPGQRFEGPEGYIRL